MSSWVGIKTAQNVNVHIFEDATIQIDINLWPKPCSEVVFTTRKLRPMTSINYITKIKNTNSMKTNRRFKLLYIKWPLCSGFIPDVSTAVNSLTHSINLINKKIDQTNTNEDSSKFKSCVQQAYKRIWELPPPPQALCRAVLFKAVMCWFLSSSQTEQNCTTNTSQVVVRGRRERGRRRQKTACFE